MIYAEFIERDRWLPLEIFRHLGDQSVWTAPGDALVGNFARTMRLGPLPPYIAFWRCHGMGRMDEWEAHFRSPEALSDRGELATHRAIHLKHGGCYDEIAGEGVADRDALFLIEHLRLASEAPAEGIAAAWRARAAAAAGGARLCFLLRRIGRLAPDPGGLAVWAVADYVALEAFERAAAAAPPPEVETVGVYRWFGREVL